MTPRALGFTLLELLVVVVSLGLSAAVATPALIKLVNSLERETRQDAARLYLQQLPLTALREHQTRQFEATQGFQPLGQVLGGQAQQRLGEDFNGARVWLPERIVYYPNGACSGGELRWELADNSRFTLVLPEPQCQPQLP
mgnify:CR=1 FL=1